MSTPTVTPDIIRAVIITTADAVDTHYSNGTIDFLDPDGQAIPIRAEAETAGIPELHRHDKSHLDLLDQSRMKEIADSLR